MINALLMSLNQLKKTDIIFFVCCAVAIALAVAVYFLIPVFNKKQYQEQRDNLRKREEAFKANKKSAVVEVATDENVLNDAPVSGDTLVADVENTDAEQSQVANGEENTDSNN